MSYANLAMAHNAVKKVLINTTSFMIRSRLYKGLTNGPMQIRTFFDDERYKLENGTHCVYCGENFVVHSEDDSRSQRHLSLKRVLLFVGVAAFAVCLAAGVLEHEHGVEDVQKVHGGINLLSEDWMNVMFACLFAIPRMAG